MYENSQYRGEKPLFILALAVFALAGSQLPQWCPTDSPLSPNT